MLGKLICRSHCPTCAQVHLRGSIKSTSIFSGLWNDEGIVEEGELGMEEGWEGEKEGSTSAGENEENEVEAEHEDGGDESGGDEGGDEIEGEDG